MKLKAITSALASAGMLALVSASGSAHADAMAGATVNMTNFQILKSTDGGTTSAQVDFADLQSLSFTSTMDMSASINGLATGNITDSTSTGPGIDQPAACVGTGCVGAINFTTNNLFPSPTAPAQGNYAAVDQLETGSPISNLSGYTGLAHVANGAYVGIATGGGEASAASNNNLNAAWQFVTGFTGAISFDFDLAVFLQVALGSLEDPPTFATSSYNIEFTLTCLTGTNCGLFGLPSITFSPSILPGGTKTLSLNSPLGNGIEIALANSGHQNSGWIPVLAERSLQLSARINTLADLDRVVPEPGILALLGLGLFGLGATLRRKSV